MSNTVQQVNKMSSGLCPHGCAPAACPICSGMGGGGMRPGERPQKPGEMSYHQCAMIGAMMKARAQQEKIHEQNLIKHADALAKFEQNIINLSQKIIQFTANIQNNVLLKPLVLFVNKLVLPTLNSVKNLPIIIANIMDKLTQLKEKIVDIQDKINAIFGEIKNFIEKKVSELVTNVKAKILNIFRIFKRNKTKDEETKIDEDKKIFNLKTFIRKLWNKQNDTKNYTGS